jgi:outer membrane protein OmpA-like peptidoglycan-associated protein
MKRIQCLTAIAVASILAACASTPDRIEELESARTLVAQVEASPRAGVAATYVAEARKALDRANKLADENGKLVDIQYEATMASRNAQIANEKILDATAKEQIEKGTAERQQVLTQAREREAAAAQERAAGLERELEDLKMQKTDRGLVLTLGDVLFDTGKATLKPGAYATIDRVAKALQESPERKVIIEGHTDSVGSDSYNQTLSEHRAQAVQAALMERGVSGSQISAIGKGETTPVASNDDAGGRQQNRRVELIFSEGETRAAAP